MDAFVLNVLHTFYIFLQADKGYYYKTLIYTQLYLQGIPGTFRNHSRFVPPTFFPVVSKELCVPDIRGPS